MSVITIIANISAHNEKIELVKAELLKLVDSSRTELGCLVYDLHQDNENPAAFTVYENWASQTCLETHIKNAAFVGFNQATENAILEFSVNKMTKIA